MSEFSSQWLQLREAADHRARHDFSDTLHTFAAARWRIVDLGCGTGSNLRYLAPRINGQQHWICIDSDARLLDALTRRDIPSGDLILETMQADLAHDASAVHAAMETADAVQPLVTASALLDLASATWIEATVDACHRQRAPALFALTWDGRIELHPAHTDDVRLGQLISAHQLGDKGFGPALGPGAAQYATAAFTRRDFSVIEADSDWQLGSDEKRLQRELIAGWLTAAREQCGDPTALADWRATRQAQIHSGTLRIRVGHRDLLALPADSPATR